MTRRSQQSNRHATRFRLILVPGPCSFASGDAPSFANIAAGFGVSALGAVAGWIFFLFKLNQGPRLRILLRLGKSAHTTSVPCRRRTRLRSTYPLVTGLYLQNICEKLGVDRASKTDPTLCCCCILSCGISLVQLDPLTFIAPGIFIFPRASIEADFWGGLFGSSNARFICCFVILGGDPIFEAACVLVGDPGTSMYERQVCCWFCGYCQNRTGQAY